MDLTSGLEVSARSVSEWEQAILKSYGVWRQVDQQHGGRIKEDLVNRTFELVE